MADAWTAKTSSATGALAAPAFCASANGFCVAVSSVELTRLPTVACSPTSAAPVDHRLSLVAASAPATTAERLTLSPRTMTARVTRVSPKASAVDTSAPATPTAVQRTGNGRGKTPPCAAQVGRDCAAVKNRTTAETVESASWDQNDAQASRLFRRCFLWVRLFFWKAGQRGRRRGRRRRRRRRNDRRERGQRARWGSEKNKKILLHSPHAERLFGDGTLVAGHERNVVGGRSGSDDEGGPGTRGPASSIRSESICSRGDRRDLCHRHAPAQLLLLMLMLMVRGRAQRRDAHATRGGQCLHF